MKTIVFLVTPPKDSETAEKMRRRFLSEKISSVFAYPGKEYDDIALSSLGSRGFEIKRHDTLPSADTPEQAKQCLRSMMGLNLGKVVVAFVPKEFINLALEGMESKERVEKDGSITTAILDWERLMRVKGVDEEI